MYRYIYINMHKYTCMWIHIVLYMFVRTCINIYAGINLENSYLFIFIYMNMYLYLNIHMYVCIRQSSVSQGKNTLKISQEHILKSQHYGI